MAHHPHRRRPRDGEDGDGLQIFRDACAYLGR
jgi:hypothetical protein